MSVYTYMWTDSLSIMLMKFCPQQAIDRPLFKDFWERFRECLTLLRDKHQRTVYRQATSIFVPASPVWQSEKHTVAYQRIGPTLC